MWGEKGEGVRRRKGKMRASLGTRPLENLVNGLGGVHCTWYASAVLIGL